MSKKGEDRDMALLSCSVYVVSGACIECTRILMVSPNHPINNYPAHHSLKSFCTLIQMTRRTVWRAKQLPRGILLTTQLAESAYVMNLISALTLEMTQSVMLDKSSVYATRSTISIHLSIGSVGASRGIANMVSTRRGELMRKGRRI